MKTKVFSGIVKTCFFDTDATEKPSEGILPAHLFLLHNKLPTRLFDGAKPQTVGTYQAEIFKENGAYQLDLYPTTQTVYSILLTPLRHDKEVEDDTTVLDEDTNGIRIYLTDPEKIKLTS